MSFVVITPPAAEPVSVAEAKLHLRVDHSDEDGAIGALISAAREAIEKRLGVAMIVRRVRATLATVCAPLQPLPIGPVSAIHSVKAGPMAGALTLLASSRYDVARTVDRPALVWLAPGAPSGARIEVEYDAGYGPTDASAPALLRHAVLMLVAHWYADREGATAFPTQVDAMLYAFTEARL